MKDSYFMITAVHNGTDASSKEVIKILIILGIL